MTRSLCPFLPQIDSLFNVALHSTRLFFDYNNNNTVCHVYKQEERWNGEEEMKNKKRRKDFEEPQLWLWEHCFFAVTFFLFWISVDFVSLFLFLFRKDWNLSPKQKQKTAKKNKGYVRRDVNKKLSLVFSRTTFRCFQEKKKSFQELHFIRCRSHDVVVWTEERKAPNKTKGSSLAKLCFCWNTFWLSLLVAFVFEQRQIFGWTRHLYVDFDAGGL